MGLILHSTGRSPSALRGDPAASWPRYRSVMDTCPAIIRPTEKNVVYLMLSDRCGPQEGDGGSHRGIRSQSDMEDNSCALLFSLKSSPAARITLSFPFGLRGVKLQRMIQHGGQQQL